MAQINFGKTVSLHQAATIISANPENRYMLRGEPGIGKSSLLAVLGEKHPNHNVAYIDVPNMDLGDIAMPVVDHERRITRYYPNARFMLHEDKPVIIMLDEFTKGADPIKNMLHPLLEEANPRLGDLPIHPKSIVFMTGNLGSDGVGDNMKAHTINRITPLTVRKPDADEWLTWALNNGVDAVVLAWVKQYPHALSSYIDGDQGDNPYIFNPKKVQPAFVSPRSLKRASNKIAVRHLFDEDTLIAGLIGDLGEAAARDMQAYIAYQDQLPSWDSIIRSPKNTAVPNSPGACSVLVFGAISKITKDTMGPFMTYMNRFEAEWAACFAINVAKNPTKQNIAFSNKEFRDWVAENEDLL